MRNALRLPFAVALVAGLAACSQVAPVAPSAADGSLRTLSLASSSSFRATPLVGGYGVAKPEFSPAQFGFGVDPLTLAALARQSLRGSPRGGAFVDRVPPKQPSTILPPQNTASSSLSLQARRVSLSFQGLDHYDQRFAASGDQFSVEPPDAALCVGGGRVLEAVNDVLRVYDEHGSAVMGTVGLNAFFGYPPPVDRATKSGKPAYGPVLVDPSCLYDAASQRWFMVVLTLATDPHSGDLTGQNQLDIAVSAGADPTAGWHLYHLDVTQDGRNCPCLGDSPHIGVDAGGLFVTTDDFALGGSGASGSGNAFNGAWLYALDKTALAKGGKHVDVVAMPLVDVQGLVGYSVWPATSVGAYPGDGNGTEYFMSSTTVFHSSSDHIDVWALTGTDTLHGRHPELSLTSARVSVSGPHGIAGYADPPVTVPQRGGSVPLAQALNDNLFGYGRPPKSQSEGRVATGDSAMRQVVYQGGRLYGALTTAADNGAGPGGGPGAGVAWFEVTPAIGQDGVSAALDRAGVVAPAGEDLMFPAVAVNASGEAVIAATLVGPRSFPSAAAIPLGPGGAGEPTVVSAGAGPQDGFTEYFLGGGRPRWGSYGASATDADGDLWIASEDVHQTCTFAAYLQDTTCGKTRSALANWSTQITEIRP